MGQLLDWKFSDIANPPTSIRWINKRVDFKNTFRNCLGLDADATCLVPEPATCWVVSEGFVGGLTSGAASLQPPSGRQQPEPGNVPPTYSLSNTIARGGFRRKQESIPVEYVPSACQPYMFWWLPLGVSSRGWVSQVQCPVGGYPLLAGPTSGRGWVPTRWTYSPPLNPPTLGYSPPSPRHTHPRGYPPPLDISTPSQVQNEKDRENFADRQTDKNDPPTQTTPFTKDLSKLTNIWKALVQNGCHCILSSQAGYFRVISTWSISCMRCFLHHAINFYDDTSQIDKWTSRSPCRQTEIHWHTNPTKDRERRVRGQRILVITLFSQARASDKVTSCLVFINTTSVSVRGCPDKKISYDFIFIIMVKIKSWENA